MRNIVYKIVDGYPIVDYPPAIEDGYLEGTMEEIKGVIKFTPQELQDAWNKEVLKPNTLQEWKNNRQILVDKIEVTYKDIIYQGDEKSQDRMSRTVNGLPDDTTTIRWIAKDNSPQQLNKLDLKQILFLAGQAQTNIWNDGRP
jgi:hypothetical protein